MNLYIWDAGVGHVECPFHELPLGNTWETDRLFTYSPQVICHLTCNMNALESLLRYNTHMSIVHFRYHICVRKQHTEVTDTALVQIGRVSTH